MRKLLFFGLALGFFLTGNAQVITENAVVIDAAEDTTQVSTINDIILIQEKVSSRNITDAHYTNVWSRKSYFNPGFVSSKLSSKQSVYLNNDDAKDLSFKSDWGVQIELGHSYALHKKAIANMVQINLDYTFIDLMVNHFKEDKSILAEFKSGEKWIDQPGTPASGSSYVKGKETYKYLPWGADKYTATYGMALGPSITIAPFTPLNIRGLHFIKVNAYYHVGYNVGMLLMDHRADNDNGTSNNNNDHKGGLSFDYLSWGHGLSTSFGISLSWKSIGIGW